MNIDKLREFASGDNTVTKTCNHLSSNVDSSSSSTTKKFGSHAPGIRKAMKILEAQFGHPHVSLLSSSSSANAFAASDHPDLHGGSSHLQEPLSQTTNVVAANGDEFGDGNNKKKMTIHSLPHPKYGPYICSKCNIEFATSQKYASHVQWIHHKGGEKKK
jgi:hypothetical protein